MCIMLSVVCCVTNMWPYVCKYVLTIPPEFCVGVSEAQDVCIKARRLTVKSYCAPKECIQFLCSQLHFNLDDMVVNASWSDDGGGEGIPCKV